MNKLAYFKELWMRFGFNGCIYVYSQLDDLHVYNIFIIPDWAEDNFTSCSTIHYFHMNDLWWKDECSQGGKMLIA